MKSNDSSAEFAKRVRRIRKGLKLSQAMVEIKSQGKVGRSWLSRIELNTIGRPSYELLHELAEALDTDLEYLLGGENPGANELREALTAEARTFPEELLGLALPLLRTLRAQGLPQAALIPEPEGPMKKLPEGLPESFYREPSRRGDRVRE